MCGFLSGCGLSEDRDCPSHVCVNGVGWTDRPAWGYLNSPGCCFHMKLPKGHTLGQDQSVSPNVDGGSLRDQTWSPTLLREAHSFEEE